MKENLIIYLHGFGSIGQNKTTNFLFDKYRQDNNTELIAETYDYCNYKATMERIEKTIITNIKRNIIICGNSFGGFIANYFAEKFGLYSVLINPVCDIKNLIERRLGENINYYTNEITIMTKQVGDFYIQLDNTRTKYPKWVLLSKNDEVLNYKIAENKYINKKIVLDEVEKHRIQSPEKIYNLLQESILNIYL